MNSIDSMMRRYICNSLYLKVIHVLDFSHMLIKHINFSIKCIIFCNYLFLIIIILFL